jgi:phosphonopyruvate decarboxylase
MINTTTFGDELKAMGFDFYSGVPCSFLKSLINYAINECDYVMAANEGDAVAIASGAKLGLDQCHIAAYFSELYV